MWRVETDRGVYAVKQLSPDINLSDQKSVENYDLTEHIASRFREKGIPAVSALAKSEKYLTVVEGVGFLIYSWVDAKMLDKGASPERYALKIARILARMHALNLDVPEISKPDFPVHTNDDLTELIQKAVECHCPFADLLKEKAPDLYAANDAYHKAIPTLRKHSVVSHGDLDQKNVLWDTQDNPILIDWESARKLNPVYEIVNASLDWSGITTNFNQDLFIKMLQSYQNAGGAIDASAFDASFEGVLGNWIRWMAYNIERSCRLEEAEQRTMGMEQVTQVLSTIVRIRQIVPEISRIIL